MHIHHNTRPVAVPVIQHPPNSLTSATDGSQIRQPQPSPQPLNSTKFKQQENGELEESRLFQFIYSNCRQNYLPGNLKLVLSTKACKAWKAQHSINWASVSCPHQQINWTLQDNFDQIKTDSGKTPSLRRAVASKRRMNQAHVSRGLKQCWVCLKTENVSLCFFFIQILTLVSEIYLSPMKTFICHTHTWTPYTPDERCRGQRHQGQQVWEGWQSSQQRCHHQRSSPPGTAGACTWKEYNRT